MKNKKILTTVLIVLSVIMIGIAVYLIFFKQDKDTTLTILENALNKKIACAVGLNTMFLFIGYVICFIDIAINNTYILIGSILFAMLSIYIAHKLYLRGEENYEKI